MLDPDERRRSSAPSTNAMTSTQDRIFDDASDLQVGFEDGYRVSWQTTLGGSPQGIVYPEHEEMERRPRRLRLLITAGVLITNRPSLPTPRASSTRADSAEIFRSDHPFGHRRHSLVLMRAFGLTIAVCLMALSTVEPRAQTARSAAEAQARRAADRLQALQREADQLTSEARSLLVDLRRLELQRQIQTEEAQQADILLKDTPRLSRRRARGSPRSSRRR